MPENNELAGGEAQIRRRKKLTTHTTAISNIVIFGYNQLSDAAKMTYIALESYDWPDENGFSKGKAWPSIATLAADRGKSYDTISRHLKELQLAGLITVESGKQLGRTNIYWLEEPSESAVTTYTARCQKRTSIGEQLDQNATKNENTAANNELTENHKAEQGVVESHLAEENVVSTLVSESENTNQKTALHKSEQTAGLSKLNTLPQVCTTQSRKSAAVGESFLPDKGIQPNQIKTKQEKDFSNRAFNSPITSKQVFTGNCKSLTAAESSKRESHQQETLDIKQIGRKPCSSSARTENQNDKKPELSSSSSYISRVMQDFSVALHDSEHTHSNQSQANKLFRQAGLSEQKFIEAMYEAKKRAQWAALAGYTNSSESPNRAAYFFVTLRRLLEEKSSGLPIGS